MNSITFLTHIVNSNVQRPKYVRISVPNIVQVIDQRNTKLPHIKSATMT